MSNRRTFLSLAAVAATTSTALFTTSAFAIGGMVDVELVDRSQNTVLRTYPYRSMTWVAGRPGNRYAVRLTNRSGARVLVVLSVDGVNAVSGETASLDQTGYVLAPYQTTEITGWRKSMTEAAAFYFTSLPDSYAARTGRPDNVGVIGVAVFRERQREVYRAPIDRSDRRTFGRAESDSAQNEARASESEAAAPSAAARPMPDAKVARDERLGTGHGEREYSPTSQTSFERAGDQPAEVIKIRYDSYENLVASGVVQGRRVPAMPDPFPGFVPDPRG